MNALDEMLNEAVITIHPEGDMNQIESNFIAIQSVVIKTLTHKHIRMSVLCPADDTR